MPRPTKCRRVCHFPQTLEFRPVYEEDRSGDSDACGHREPEPVILTVDEYEIIRLIDKEGLSQGECSACMDVARTTVQRCYEIARRKLADALVEGRTLRIEGGDFLLCDGHGTDCRHGQCFKQFYHRQYQKPKGDQSMRVAVTYENGEIFQHFGHTQQFKVYDVENGAVTASEVVDTDGKGHGALAGVLGALKADILICGGIGGGAQAALGAAGIRLYAGISGSADAAVAALLEGTLPYHPNANCSHHEHGHGEGHTCGEHGCGNHQ